MFVVQKHAARRLHYDFRLQLGGTLRSWAVPKGPCLDPATKRLAIEVEDHPIDYADFEGVIAEGNYGAGPVIVWDRGQWIAVEDPKSGLEKGKLLFELKGYKLRGIWTLVRTKPNPKQWLLIKKPDAYALAEPPQFDERSVLSGLTVEQRESVAQQMKPLREKLRAWKTPRTTETMQSVRPMLATAHEKAFTDDDWLFELKYDGYRLLAFRQGINVRLQYRRGSNATPIFPEVTAALKTLPAGKFLLDGEIVVLNEQGFPSFQRLQQRSKLTRANDIGDSRTAAPATYFVFDLLAFEEFDLRSLALSQRKEALSMLIPHMGPVRFADHVEAQGEALLESVAKLGLEGIIAKRKDSSYLSNIRSSQWLKVKLEQTELFVVVGFTLPPAGRVGLGALLLAERVDSTLVYAGRVGTGFKDSQLRELHKMLKPLIVKRAPCEGPLPESRNIVWVKPTYMAQVRYHERTAGGLLRLPVFLRLDDERMPEATSTTEVAPPRATSTPHTTSEITNAEKIFWPKQGYTKKRLVDYYRAVSRWLLPYLKDRPLVLTRYPDGIDGKHFYQKDAPGFVPDWIRTERIWSEHTQREIDYFVCQDIESLAYIINLATIPLHIWASRVGSLQHPDWCVIDLDPKSAPFRHVLTLARAFRTLCTSIQWKSYIKTTGSTGLHILLPLAGQCTHEQARLLAELLSRIVAKKFPKIATLARPLEKRRGRVYLDFGQNGHGKTIVSPYSVRPIEGAPISMPLSWAEITPRLTPRAFTIANGITKLKRQRREPLLQILNDVPDLVAILGRLTELEQTSGQ